MALFLVGLRTGKGDGNELRRSVFKHLLATRPTKNTGTDWLLAWVGLRRVLVRERTDGSIASRRAFEEMLRRSYQAWADKEPASQGVARLPALNSSPKCQACGPRCWVRVPAGFLNDESPRIGPLALTGPRWRESFTDVSRWARSTVEQLGPLLGADPAPSPSPMPTRPSSPDRSPTRRRAQRPAVASRTQPRLRNPMRSTARADSRFIRGEPRVLGCLHKQTHSLTRRAHPIAPPNPETTSPVVTPGVRRRTRETPALREPGGLRAPRLTGRGPTPIGWMPRVGNFSDRRHDTSARLAPASDSARAAAVDHAPLRAVRHRAGRSTPGSSASTPTALLPKAESAESRRQGPRQTVVLQGQGSELCEVAEPERYGPRQTVGRQVEHLQVLKVSEL